MIVQVELCLHLVNDRTLSAKTGCEVVKVRFGSFQLRRKAIGVDLQCPPHRRRALPPAAPGVEASGFEATSKSHV